MKAKIKSAISILIFTATILMTANAYAIDMKDEAFLNRNSITKASLVGAAGTTVTKGTVTKETDPGKITYSGIANLPSNKSLSNLGKNSKGTSINHSNGFEFYSEDVTIVRAYNDYTFCRTWGVTDKTVGAKSAYKNSRFNIVDKKWHFYNGFTKEDLIARNVVTDREITGYNTANANPDDKHIIAYILSEQAVDYIVKDGQSLKPVIQMALWKTTLNTETYNWKKPKAYTQAQLNSAKELYAKAEKYKSYKLNYEKPAFDDTIKYDVTSDNGNLIIGPFKVTYTTTNGYGNILEATITVNGTTYKIGETRWVFLDSKKQQQGVDWVPSSGKQFYIKLIHSNLKNIKEIGFDCYFNDLNCKAALLKLTGTKVR